MEKYVFSGDVGAVVVTIDIAAIIMLALLAWGARTAWRQYLKVHGEDER